MSMEQKFWTFSQMLDKVHLDTDIDEEDPDETFVTFEEFIGYFNEGIDEAKGEVLKIDEDYFLTRDYLPMLAGVSEYAMPDNIHADKFRGIVFDDGTYRYPVRRIRRKDLFMKIGQLQDPLASNADYSHYIRNDRAGERTFVILPPSRETAILPPAAGARTPITRWFIRNANRIPMPGEYVNPDDVLPADFNLATGAITVDPVTPYVTGDAVQFSLKSPAFVMPAGLSAGTTYYVVRLSDTRIKLAGSLAAAKAAVKGLVTGDRVKEVPAGLINGVNVIFTLSQVPYSPNSVTLYLDGVYQRPGEHYTLVGQTITMLVAPALLQELDVTYYPQSDTPTTNPSEVQEVPAGLIDGVNLTYLLSKTPANAAALDIYLDGVLQVLGTHYELAGKTVTFYIAPAIGQELDAVYDTSVLFFSTQGTGFFTIRVQATKPIILSTVIDIPEFAIFIMEWVKANCLYKDGDPRLSGTVAKVEEQRKQAVETLTEREPDDDNTMELDLSFYQEMN
jgi:hypothetical protein